MPGVRGEGEEDVAEFVCEDSGIPGIPKVGLLVPVFGFTVDTVVVQPGHDPGLLSQVLVSTSMTDEVQPPVENFALQPIRGTASRGTRCVEEQGREVEVAIHTAVELERRLTTMFAVGLIVGRWHWWRC
jgi:hypothetical protein